MSSSKKFFLVLREVAGTFSTNSAQKRRSACVGRVVFFFILQGDRQLSGNYLRTQFFLKYLRKYHTKIVQ